MEFNEFQPLDKNTENMIPEQVTGSENNEEPPKPSFFARNKMYIIAIIVLLVLAIGLGTYFYSSKNPIVPKPNISAHESLKNNIPKDELEELKNSLDVESPKNNKPSYEVKSYIHKYQFIDSIPDSQILTSNPTMAQMYINAKKIYNKIIDNNKLPDKYDNITLLYLKQLYDSAKNILPEEKLKPKPKPKSKPKPKPSPIVELDVVSNVSDLSDKSEKSEIKKIDTSQLKDLNED